MATTTWTTEPDEMETIKLTDGTISIGRATDNDVSIHDTFVSAHHARIFTYQSASYIEDLGSTNGTFINDKKVSITEIKDQSEFKVGQTTLMLITTPKDKSFGK